VIGVTHIVLGVGTTSLLLGSPDPVLLFAGGVASLLPDIDVSSSPFGRALPWVSQWFERRFAHRSCTHSLVASGVLALLVYPFATIGYVDWHLAHAVNIGYFAGYFADIFSKTGIELFWPHSIRAVSPGNRNLRLQTGSSSEYAVLLLSVALTVLILHINTHGGIREQFDRLLGTPEGVEQVYDSQGSSHLIVAHIKGVRASDRAPVAGDFWIIDSKGKDFIVQSENGEIYKAGIEPEAQLIIEHVVADVGPVARIQVESIDLDDDRVAAKLRWFLRPDAMVFVSGELKVDDLDDVQIVRDPSQLQILKKSSSGVTLEDAPLKVVIQKLGRLFATGELTIRSIYAQTTAATSLKS
jgi:inner membrane protein